MMKILFLMLTVGLVWGQPQPPIKSGKEGLMLYISQVGSNAIEVKTYEDVIDSKNSNDPNLVQGLVNVNQVHDHIPVEPNHVTITNTPPAERRVSIDLSERIFYANYEDSQFDRKTLDLSSLDLSGEDVKEVLYSLNATVLASVARIDLRHNRVWDLPARVWPLQLEYSLVELRLDHNWLNLADPINTRTTRFELTRLRSLQKLSLSNCGFGSTLEAMEFPPVKSLDLSNNKLVDLPSSLATLTTLQHLDMSGNRLRYLSKSPISSLTGLLTLNLSHNGMERMWDDPLEELYSLETLHLNNNALSEPPKLYQFTGSYQPRMDVSLRANPFKCGCAFKNTMDIGRLRVVDKSNVTCVDDDGVEWSMDTVAASRCSPHWESVRQKWTGTKEWFKDNRPDWSTLYRSIGWLLFGVTLGLVYAHRRAKKTPPPTTQVPYNILDEQAVY